MAKEKLFVRSDLETALLPFTVDIFNFFGRPLRTSIPLFIRFVRLRTTVRFNVYGSRVVLKGTCQCCPANKPRLIAFFFSFHLFGRTLRLVPAKTAS